MIKLITLLKRGPLLNREEFAARWLRVHAPKAAVFAGFARIHARLLDRGSGACRRRHRPALIRQPRRRPGILRIRDRSAGFGRCQSPSRPARPPPGERAPAPERARSRGAPLQARCVGETPGRRGPWSLRRLVPGRGVARARRRDRRCQRPGQLGRGRTAPQFRHGGALDLVNGEAVLDAMLELWLASEADGRAALARVRDEELPRIAGRVGATETALLYEHVVVPPSPSAYGLPSGSET